MKNSFRLIVVSLLGALVNASAAAAVMVTGSLHTDTLWSASQGPYLVQGVVVVEKGAVLTLEPGTEVRFQPSPAGQTPSALVVRGGLTAIGTDSRPISFLPTAAGGLWGGLYFDGSDPAHSLLEDCVIKGGQVVVNESSPTLLRCLITGSRSAIVVGSHSAPLIVANSLTRDTYGLYLRSSTADPVVRRNQVYENDYGVYLQDFGKPRFTANNILRNRRYNLVNASPKPINMAGNDFGPEDPSEASRTIYDASRNSRVGRVDLSAGAVGTDAGWAGPRLALTLNGLFAQRVNGATLPFGSGLGNNFRVEYEATPGVALGLALGYDAFTGNGKAAYASNLDATGRLTPIHAGALGFYMLGGVGANLMTLQPSWQGHFHALAGLGTQYAMDSNWGVDLGAVFNFYTPIASPLQTLDFHFGVTYGFGL